MKVPPHTVPLDQTWANHGVSEGGVTRPPTTWVFMPGAGRGEVCRAGAEAGVAAVCAAAVAGAAAEAPATPMTANATAA